MDTFIEKAKRYTAIDKLTPELLRLFVQRIEVGERSKKYSRSAAQSVRIIYRDIGSMDSPMEPKGFQPHDTPEADVNANQKMSIFAGMKCHFSPVSMGRVCSLDYPLLVGLKPVKS